MTSGCPWPGAPRRAHDLVDGRRTYDELMEQAELLSAAVKSAAVATASPPAPDQDALDALCASLVEQVHAAA